MGEAYKGLTIRIGADASELKKALRASDSAINATQKQLRQLANAAKLDPASTKVFAERMDVLGDKAQALNVRLQELKSSNFMQNLAVDTQDAALKAKYATEEYARMCDEIKRFKNQIAVNAGIDPFKKGQDPFANIADGTPAAIRMIRQLSANTDEANQNIEHYLDLVRRWGIANDNNVFASINQDIDKFKTKLVAAEAETRAIYAEMARLAAINPAITQTAQFERFRREMDRAEISAKELRAELATLDSALDIDPYNIDAARLRMANLNEQVRLNVVRMEQLDKQINSMKSKGIDKVAAKYADLRQEIARAEGEAAKWSQRLDEARTKLLKMEADTSVSKVSKEFKEAQAEVEKFEKKVASAERRLNRLGNARVYSDLRTELAATSAATNKLIDDMKDVGKQAGVSRASFQQLGWALYSTLTPAFMTFGYRAVNAAEEVDAAYRNMRKTVEGTEEQFEGMKQAAIDYSRTHVTDAATLLEIEAMGGQLGIATDKLEGFATTISNLEIATNLDADTAAEQLGQLAGILNDMTQDDFAKFGDALVRLGNNNATLEDKIMDVMLRIGSMGTITGFTTTELLAWSTAVAATGQGAEAAGTAISNTFSDIETAVGKGGDSLEAFAEVAGMSSSQFAKMWSESPSDAMHAFIDGLKAIEESGGSADSTLNDLGITGVRQKQSILGLVQTIDGLNANLTMSENAWNGMSDDWGAAGDAAREADAKTQGFSGAIQLLRNNVDALGVEMGESLTPTIQALTEFVAGVTQLYSDLPDPAKYALDFLVLAGALAGPVIVGYNAVRNAAKDFTKDLANGKTAMERVAKEGIDMIQTNERAAVAFGMSGDAADKATKKYGKTQRAIAFTTGALGKLSKYVPGIAGMLALEIVVSEIMEYVEYANLMEEATEGMVRAAEAAKLGFAEVDASTYVDSAEQVVKAAREVTESNAGLASELQDTWSSVNNETTLVGKYVDVINDLAYTSDLSATDQVRLKSAIEGVNEICGTSYQVVDAVNGKLSESTEAIVANTRAWQENAKQQAAYQSLMDVQAKIVETEAMLAVANAKLAESSKGVGLYIGDFAVAANPAAVAFHELEGSAADLEAELGDLQFAEQYYLDLLGSYTVETEEVTTSTNSLTEEVTALVDGLSGLAADSAFFRDMLADSGMTVEELAVTMDNAGVSMDSLSQKMEDYAEQTANAFAKIEGVSDVTLSGMLETLQHNAEITRNWSSNIAALYDKAGSDSQRAFIDYIAGMGVEYAPIVGQLLNDSSGMLGQLADAWADSMAAGKEAALTETQIFADQAAQTLGSSGDLVADALLTQKEPAASAANEVATAVNDEFASIDTVYTGEQWALGITEGMGNKVNAIIEQSRALVRAADWAMKDEAQIYSPSRLSMESGEFYGEGWGVGIDKSVHYGVESSRRMVQEAIAAARKTIGSDGLTLQARIAGEFAAGAGRASGAAVTNNTSTVNNYLSVGGIDLSDNKNAMDAAWALFQELEWRADT